MSEIRKAFVSPPTSCFCQSPAGVNWCVCIEWDGTTTMEKVAPVHLPLVVSPHPFPGPAPLKRRPFKLVEKRKTEERNRELLQRTQEPAFLLAASLSHYTSSAPRLEKEQSFLKWYRPIQTSAVDLKKGTGEMFSKSFWSLKVKKFSSRMGEACAETWIGFWGPSHCATFPRCSLQESKYLLGVQRKQAQPFYTWCSALPINNNLRIWRKCHSGDCISSRALYWLSDGFAMIKLRVRSETKIREQKGPAEFKRKPEAKIEFPSSRSLHLR